MFKINRKKKNETGVEIIHAPVKGNVVESIKINDPVFGQEMLGKGMAIIPTEGRVYAPANGKIEMMISSMHAISMISDGDVEILLHIGIDTVKLGGKYFKAHTKIGKKVKQGDLLMEVDLEAIKKAGYDTIIPVIICNSNNYAKIECVEEKEVIVGEWIMKLKK